MYPNCNQGYTGFVPNATYPPINPLMAAQTMQPQQPTMNNLLCGRIVNSRDDIKPNEVPMDGSLAIFPINNGSSIVTKQWNSDGTIRTNEYKKVEEVVPIEKEEDTPGWDELKAYLDSRFDKIEKMSKKEAKTNA